MAARESAMPRTDERWTRASERELVSASVKPGGAACACLGRRHIFINGNAIFRPLMYSIIVLCSVMDIKYITKRDIFDLWRGGNAVFG